MTPQQALAVLDQMSARALGNRDDHIAVTHAVQVLRPLCEPAKKEEPARPPATPAEKPAE